MSATSDLSIVMQEERWEKHCKDCMYWNHYPEGMPCCDCLYEPINPETDRPEYFEED